MAFAIAVTHVAAGRGDTLAVSGPRGSYLLDGGTVSVRCDRSGHGRVWLARSGVGYGLLANNSMRRVEYDDGRCSIDPWTYEHPLRSIVAVAAVDENLYLAGTDPASGAVQIRVADERGHDRGNLGATNTQADDGFCSVSALGGCDRGLCVLDTTCDRVRAWSRRGRHIGNATASTLLGVAGLTLTAVAPGERETFIAATARREPAAASVHEGLLFAVRGL
jgi:hypothetical protein